MVHVDFMFGGGSTAVVLHTFGSGFPLLLLAVLAS
jgi:hypothetical protein